MKSNRFLVLGVVIVLLVSCSDAPKIKGLIDPSIIQFSGDKALKALHNSLTGTAASLIIKKLQNG
jgi:hypothetical protein